MTDRERELEIALHKTAQALDKRMMWGWDEKRHSIECPRLPFAPGEGPPCLATCVDGRQALEAAKALGVYASAPDRFSKTA